MPLAQSTSGTAGGSTRASAAVTSRVVCAGVTRSTALDAASSLRSAVGLMRS
jgi:hypothetical protein